MCADQPIDQPTDTGHGDRHITAAQQDKNRGKAHTTTASTSGTQLHMYNPSQAAGPARKHLGNRHTANQTHAPTAILKVRDACIQVLNRRKPSLYQEVPITELAVACSVVPQCRLLESWPNEQRPWPHLLQPWPAFQTGAPDEIRVRAASVLERCSKLAARPQATERPENVR